MADAVVIDEWAVMLRGAATLSPAVASRLRAEVGRELSATADRLSRALAPSASVEVLPP
jgi:hypothetical protein